MLAKLWPMLALRNKDSAQVQQVLIIGGIANIL
jgi:hypothetical protein